MKNKGIIWVFALLFGIAPAVSAQDEVDEEMMAFMMDFTEKLTALIADYEYNFANVKGDMIPKESEYDVLDNFYSKVNLPATDESYITAITGTDRLTYVAVFTDTEDLEEAFDIYSGIVFLAGLITCNCCVFTPNVYDEPNDLFLMRTEFVPEYNDSFQQRFANLNLMVSIYPSFDIDAELNIKDTYMVVLNINSK